MLRSVWALAAVAWICLLSACEDPKPILAGRLRRPSALAMFKGCPQDGPGCNRLQEGHHLLLISNAFDDDLRIFDVEQRSFFQATNPLFPLRIPVGPHPRSIAVDPHGEFAFVVNQLSDDVSVVDLAPNRLVEVDTDGDVSTRAASLDCPEDADQRERPLSDRCLAGVSRVVLGSDSPAQPEQIAVPAGDGDDPQGPWDREQVLPAYVSLPGTGQVAVLHFSYPGRLGSRQRMATVAGIPIGGVPSGLAVTRDGSLLFVANEGADSIALVDTATRSVQSIAVDGPSRRVFLTPDEKVVYVFLRDEGRIALVDVERRERISAGASARPEAQNPDEHPENRDRPTEYRDIVLPAIPREITFVHGHTLNVSGEEGTTTYPLDEEPVKTLGYVSDLDGRVYIVDAVNHRSIDLTPVAGPQLTTEGTDVGPPYMPERGKESVQWTELVRCWDIQWERIEEEPQADCAYPQIADYDLEHGDEVTDLIYKGIWVHPGRTRQEGWVLIWEGVLPGTDLSTSGRFNGWRLEDDRVGLDFVAAGVEPGDVLKVTSDPSPAVEGEGENPACIPDGGTEVLGELRISEVVEPGASYLELEPVAGVDPGQCWREALRYEVRARQAWVVRGTESGMQKRLRMTPTPEQLPPDDQRPVAPAYTNGQISLTLYEPRPDADGTPRPILRDAFFGVQVLSGFSHAYFQPTAWYELAGPILAIDLEDGADQPGEGDEQTGPADDRIFLLFESSNALMEFYPGTLKSSTNYILYF